MLDALKSIAVPTQPLAGVAALLSVLAFGLLALLWRDCGRRAGRFRAWSLAGRKLRPARVAGAWRALLVAAFLLGLRGLPVATEARSLVAPVDPPPGAMGLPAGEEAVALAGGPSPARATTTALRLPFWIHSARAEETADGRTLGGSVRDTLQVPWPFLVAVALYALLGIRPSRPGDGRPGRSPAGAGPAGAAPDAGPRMGPGAGFGAAGGRGGRARLLLLVPLAAGLILAPGPRSAAASGCGGTDGLLCYTYTQCKRILIIQRCTTEYGYYPAYV